MSNKTIAIVEDDPIQRENYADALTAQGYEVVTYANRPSAEAGFDVALPDLAILDIMLEDDMDGGFDICRTLRRKSTRLPIIFLTARDSDVDRVSGLRLDAWDYLTKPVNLQFLGVRINSLFRIADTVADNAAKSEAAKGAHDVGGLHIDDAAFLARWQGDTVNLTLTEFWVVQALARLPGTVKSYDALMQVTRQSHVERNTINGYIRRIRHKFKAVDPDFDQIETVFGIGYRWKQA